MRLLFTSGYLRYYHHQLEKFIVTSNRIPFLVDSNGCLVELVNYYLLMKTEISWTEGNDTPFKNAQDILNYLSFCEHHNIDWFSCSTKEIQRYIKFLFDLKGNEIEESISSIFSMYYWLLQKSYLKSTPFTNFEDKEINVFINFLSYNKNLKLGKISKNENLINSYNITLNDIQQLYPMLQNDYKLMITFILQSGIRKDELLQLTIDIFNTRTKSPSGNAYAIMLDSNKMKIKYNKSRIIVIGANLVSNIEKWLSSPLYIKRKDKYIKNHGFVDIENLPIFISNRGQIYSNSSLNKAFNLKEKPYITPSSLRNFYALHYLSKKSIGGICNDKDYKYLTERLGNLNYKITKSSYSLALNQLNKENYMKNLLIYNKLFEDFLDGKNDN